MSLFYLLLIGCMMIICTVVIHAVMLDQIMKHTGMAEKTFQHVFKRFWKPLLSACIVATVFLSHIIHIWLWVGVYKILDCLPTHQLPDILYFSTVTYTTLGYGDIVLPPGYRMLSGIEAANGFLLFGWTAAFTFEIFSRLYRNEARSI